MTPTIATQTKELESILADLPFEKAQALMDFAHYLRQRYTPQPPRGSASTILEKLAEIGPLQFEEGELEMLLADIEAMRQMDLLEHG